LKQLGANKALKNNDNTGLTALTVDKMISEFPNPVVPLITANPTCEYTMNRQKLPNANHISIHSLTGGGHNGHHGFIMMVQEHAVI
jgi:hypothetical protein